MHQVERRHLDRFKISGAKVSFNSNDRSVNLVSLLDISKSSVRFEFNGDLGPGDRLELEIKIPAKEKISIKGHIVRTSKADIEHPCCTVVQFMPFGSDERYNSTDSYNQLNEILKEYQNIPEIRILN